MTLDQDPDGIGSVAEEAARLLAALGAPSPTDGVGLGRSTRGRPVPGPRTNRSAPGAAANPCTCGSNDQAQHGAAAADQGAECRICPVCLGIRVLKDIRPEMLASLADLATDIATSLRVLADDRRPPRPGAPPRSGENPQREGQP